MPAIIYSGTKRYYTGTMNRMTSSTVKVNLPEGIMQNSAAEAERIGISLQDFIRLLLATYFSRSEGITNVSRDKVLLDNAKSEIKKGKYKEFADTKELSEYLLSK